jgi:flagellar L-ring protein FlgH
MIAASKALGRVTVALVGVIALAGCDTMDHFQKPPNFSGPGTVDQIPAPSLASPSIAANFGPPSTPAEPGSLWEHGSKTFFRDPRALNVGDLLTVQVNLQEQAEFDNQANLNRTTQNTMSISNLFGIGNVIGSLLLGGTTNPAINTSGSSITQGQGDIKRTDNMVVNIAATVLHVMPNHNLEIAGSQEIRLNNELRQLQIRGVVRPEDIRSDNTITSDKIAEARIEYGGRGVSSDLQRPAWGQDVLNRVQPF